MFRTLFNFQCPFSFADLFFSLGFLPCFQVFFVSRLRGSFYILSPSFFLVKHFFNFFRYVFRACISVGDGYYIITIAANCQTRYSLFCVPMRFSSNQLNCSFYIVQYKTHSCQQVL